MYLEKRKQGNSIKYYLVYSYRDSNNVKKIRKYLGQDLKQNDLEKAKKEAKQHILELSEKLNTKVFLFSLTKKQVESLNRYNDKIQIYHLDQKEWQRFKEDFVYNTNAIEGSTVQLHEVKDLLNEKLNEKKPANFDELETRGVAQAFDYIRNANEELSLQVIKKLHEFCFKETKQFAGKFRNVNVVIRNSRGEVIHAGVEKFNLMFALNDLVVWYKKNKSRFRPLVLAAIIHNQFEYIHPFQDGNGRVGRLLLNFILLEHNYPPISISLEDRQEYYQTLQQYSNSGNLKPTMQFLIKQYKKTLKKVSTKKTNRKNVVT